MIFKILTSCDEEGIVAMSSLATAIVREHYDPILGKEQNDYMLEKFQSTQAIKEQMDGGYRYWFAMTDSGDMVGFLAFYPRKDALYLSKLYIKKECRGKGYGKEMMSFVQKQAREEGLFAIELNVNKENYNSIKVYEHLGFVKIRDEKNPIGKGYYMDDYVYRYAVEQ